MARLMGIPMAELKGQDRVTLARQQAEKWGHIVLLKGAFTVVAAPDGRALLLPFATPALSTAGSGDVLAGVIVALLGRV
jgi:ADP-dependent NAD(P)H-hydrate dehydratase / NAD(P)H-hydrate epimerase